MARNHVDLVDSATVSAALKTSSDKGINSLEGDLHTDKALTQTHHVGVIVESRKAS